MAHMAAPDTLLIDDGDLASLTLLALQPDPSRLMLWHTRTFNARLEAVQLRAEMCGKSRLIVSEPALRPLPEMRGAEHVLQAEALLRAAALAMHLRLTRILWPIAIGEDHVLIAEALERAAAIAMLADPSGALLIDAPIVDLNDAQLVELADEAGAPMRAFWPCDHDREQPCDSCAGCMRWAAAFDGAGVEWPFGGTALQAVRVVARLSEP